MAAPHDQLRQLGEAHDLVLKDPAYWPQVLHGVLPMFSNSVFEVRRWGADFLAETFSTPVLDARAKQELALACLDTLLWLSNETETGILKSVVQCSASVYPIIFRHMYVLPTTTLLAALCPTRARIFFPARTGIIPPHAPRISHSSREKEMFHCRGVCVMGLCACVCVYAACVRGRDDLHAIMKSTVD
jgi:hypothetical protein